MNTHPSLTAVSPTAGNLRWLAPEIFNPLRAGVPLESARADVFAFGMLAIEVFTGTLPFVECDSEEVIRRILEGTRPELPRNAGDVGLTTERWQLLQRCWDQDPANRPTMEEVARIWEDPPENTDRRPTPPGKYFLSLPKHNQLISVARRHQAAKKILEEIALWIRLIPGLGPMRLRRIIGPHRKGLLSSTAFEKPSSLLPFVRTTATHPSTEAAITSGHPPHLGRERLEWASVSGPVPDGPTAVLCRSVAVNSPLLSLSNHRLLGAIWL
jgi:serine/threonine protein kinase